MRKFLLGVLLLCYSGWLYAAELTPWMRAEWTSEAPRFRELGIDPQALGRDLGERVLVFAHPLRDVSLPGADGPRNFKQVRFSSSVARIDLPAPELKRILFDLNRVKEFNPLLTQSNVVQADGRNIVARYRIEVPLPVLSLKMDFRVKHLREEDSMSAVILDGQAESLLAMLGGFSEDMSRQAGLFRTEVIALDAGHSLVVNTAWIEMHPNSWVGKLALKQYPEIQVVMPYLTATTVTESIRRRFSPVGRHVGDVPGYSTTPALQPLLESLSANGFVALLHPAPQPPLIPGAKAGPRYVSVATRLDMPPARARSTSTQFARWPEVFPEIRGLKVSTQPKITDLDLKIRVGLSVLTLPFDVKTRNWHSPQGLEFARLSGDLERVEGSGEWLPRGDGTLLYVSAGFVLGDDAPWLVRKLHDIAKDLPFIDELSTMAVEMGALTRFKPWVERQGQQVATK